MSKILMIIAPELFSQKELFITKEILEKNGHEIVIASSFVGECTGSGESVATAALALADVRTENFDAVVFVGGRGSTVYYSNEEAFRIAREMAEAGKVTAAICLASAILANAGVLKGKHATVAKTEVKTIELQGAIYSGPEITVDDNIITVSSPKFSKKFGEKIDEKLRSRN